MALPPPARTNAPSPRFFGREYVNVPAPAAPPETACDVFFRGRPPQELKMKEYFGTVSPPPPSSANKILAPTPV